MSTSLEREQRKAERRQNVINQLNGQPVVAGWSIEKPTVVDEWPTITEEPEVSDYTQMTVSEVVRSVDAKIEGTGTIYEAHIILED